MNQKFYENVLLKINGHLQNGGCNPAFCIGKNTYTYSEFAHYVRNIREVIKSRGYTSGKIGLVINNDIQTYASILALWNEGCCYVPLHPLWPIDRCLNIITQVNLDFILDSTEESRFDNDSVIFTSKLPAISNEEVIMPKGDIADEKFAYILFTSGSTGLPKGVPITRGNLAAFVDSMANIGLDISSQDKCLQPFDLSFDFSVSGYVIPLVNGAEIFTVPLNKNKITSIARLLLKHELTVLQMVPSMMRNLLPYIEELDLTSIRYNIFCGESLSADLTSRWHNANPEMISYNMYGPTEDTVFCTYYLIDKENQNGILHSNDVVSVGKTFKNGNLLLLDDNNKVINQSNVEGELCLCGLQLTPGYWNNNKDNSDKFFNYNGSRYYRSGDLCYYSDNMNLMYIGRIDNQIKLNGFRVELGEIEHKFSSLSNDCFCVVIPYHDENNNLSLALVIEGLSHNINPEIEQLKRILPPYEVPSQFLFMNSIPLNQNGKVDRKAIKEFFKLQ